MHKCMINPADRNGPDMSHLSGVKKVVNAVRVAPRGTFDRNSLGARDIRTRQVKGVKLSRRLLQRTYHTARVVDTERLRREIVKYIDRAIEAWRKGEAMLFAGLIREESDNYLPLIVDAISVGNRRVARD